MSEQKSEEKPVGLTEEQMEEIRTKAREKARSAKHVLRQRGIYLVCVSCDYPHTFKYIGPNKRLVGFKENGTPIVEDLK